jgi:predicted DNA-binding ribbon-helix-helix protein
MARETPLKKRSVNIAGHRTSITVEEPFWDALKAIAKTRGTSMTDLIAEIDSDRGGNLSSAVRLFVLSELRKAAKV